MEKQWRRLHRLAYIAGVLAVLHYYSLAKIGKTEPVYYIVVLSILLGHRVLVRLYRRWDRKVDDGMEVKNR